MSWGDSNWGSTWGTSGISSSTSCQSSPPEGQHAPSCLAGRSGWGYSGWNSGYYDASCKGCQHSRSSLPFGGSGHTKNGVVTLLSIFGVYQATKSVMDK
ncbi:hypothetical protein DPMN_174645 [Dreissena polymorpha]|uniref:Uncharacterized protein n=1 Tax=Dreissena polymorpha TaxID=45954 RepID=A0A9D4IFB4_DREPO|nr:hypothetical protein DPMN_174645 [Dreissena polymorpha]